MSEAELIATRLRSTFDKHSGAVYFEVHGALLLEAANALTASLAREGEMRRALKRYAVVQLPQQANHPGTYRCQICKAEARWPADVEHNLSCDLRDTALASPAPLSGGTPKPFDWIGEVCCDVAELPDRTSPDDQPDMMLVTADELRRIIGSHAPSSGEEKSHGSHDA